VQFHRLYVEVKGLGEEFDLVLAIDEITHPLDLGESRLPGLGELSLEALGFFARGRCPSSWHPTLSIIS
jgi:hypothetical protein